MTKQQKFSLIKRFKSFKYAFAGIITLVKEEHNSRVHLFATMCVITAGIFFEIALWEWVAVALAVTLVIALELVNSAIENLVDFVSDEKHKLLKNVKDMAAAAVLIAAIGSVVIGLIIFIPKILCAL